MWAQCLMASLWASAGLDEGRPVWWRRIIQRVTNVNKRSSYTAESIVKSKNDYVWRWRKLSYWVSHWCFGVDQHTDAHTIFYSTGSYVYCMEGERVGQSSTVSTKNQCRAARNYFAIKVPMINSTISDTVHASSSIFSRPKTGNTQIFPRKSEYDFWLDFNGFYR